MLGNPRPRWIFSIFIEKRTFGHFALSVDDVLENHYVFLLINFKTNIKPCLAKTTDNVCFSNPEGHCWLISSYKILLFLSKTRVTCFFININQSNTSLREWCYGSNVNFTIYFWQQVPPAMDLWWISQAGDFLY